MKFIHLFFNLSLFYPILFSFFLILVLSNPPLCLPLYTKPSIPEKKTGLLKNLEKFVTVWAVARLRNQIQITLKATSLGFTVTDLTDDSRVLKISNARQYITKKAIENSAANLIPPGSVVLTTRVAVGKVGLTTQPIATNQDCTSFIPRKGLYSEFLAVWLLANRDLIKSLSRGIGIMGVRRIDLENLDIPLPPISEQKKIVAYLDALSQKYQELQKLQEETAADIFTLKQSVLTQAFNQN